MQKNNVHHHLHLDAGSPSTRLKHRGDAAPATHSYTALVVPDAFFSATPRGNLGVPPPGVGQGTGLGYCNPGRVEGNPRKNLLFASQFSWTGIHSNNTGDPWKNLKNTSNIQVT